MSQVILVICGKEINLGEGHSYSWGKGYPDATAKCPSLVSNINRVPMHPGRQICYDLLSAVVNEMAPIMVDEYYHFGADEVIKACWAEDETVRKFMQEQGFGENYDKLFAYFERKLEPIYRKQNKKMVCWDDYVIKQNEFKPPKDSIIQVWKIHDNLITAVKSGYKTILSAGWYLSYARTKGNHSKSHTLFYDTWQV